LGQNGNGGHAHNDQLSIELNIDGVDVIRDPGTYVYTPFPELRNRFRSTAVHFTPAVGSLEQNKWFPGVKGLFHLFNESNGECLLFNSQVFLGRHFGFGAPVYRFIKISNQNIEIYDFGAEKNGNISTILSKGYGQWIEKSEF